MTKISRLPLNPEKMAECMNMLWSSVTLMGSKEDVRLLFKDLFSHTELKMSAKRIAVARKLLDGKGYEEIIRELKVTDRTVAHINNILAEKGDGFRKAHFELDYLEKRQLEKEKSRIDNLSKAFKSKYGSDALPNLVAGGFTKALDKVSAKQKKSSAKRKLAV